MTRTVLWTQAELAAAFALLLPEAEARAMAARWWEMFAEGEDVDPEGRFVYDGPWGAPQPRAPGDEVEDDPTWHTPAQVQADEALFAGRAGASLEGLLVRLGDLHLALAALVRPALYERMRVARFMSPWGAARNRLQLARAIGAHRRSTGLPFTLYGEHR